MARTKTDPLVAKQAKQKKILIGLSIVFAVILVIQVPKLMGGGKKSSTAAPTATTPDATTPAPTTAPGTTGTPTVAAVQTGPTTLVEASNQKAGRAQLASFSLFEAKDPFVQQLKAPDGAPGAASAGAPGSGGGKGGSGAGGKVAPAAPTFATISVNGEEQALVVKGLFPIEEPLFRLVAVTGKSVKIGIAGGALANGKTITLRKGDKLTLVDTATGARYTLELHYTGTTPEETEVFTTGSGETAATGAAQQTVAPTSAP